MPASHAPLLSLLDRVHPLLEGVSNPGQYLGGEVNAVVKPLPTETGSEHGTEAGSDPGTSDGTSAGTVTGRMALCYPDLYEIGASHNGSMVLYDTVNRADDLACERCMTPWPDMAAAMRAADVPLFTLENHLPVAGFDVLGFTLQTELTYTNILETLDLAGIPLLGAERDDSHPVVIAGGHGAHSPEVLAEFIDVFLPGDGEEILPELLRFVAAHRAQGTPRAELLHLIGSTHPWAYVPSLYEPAYDGDAFAGLTPRFDDVPARVSGGAVFDFGAVPVVTHPVVPNTKTVHETVSIEIMRGCTRGCRFCQAGMITRPMRYRTVEQLVQAAERAVDATGYDEVTLTSLSSGDYPWIEELLTAMAERLAPKRVSVSLPSLRVTGELANLPGLTNSVRKSSLTFAPEVATDRLRAIINKDIKNADVLKSAEAAYLNGWSTIKLYYMIGIPGEREEDLAAIVEFADELSRLRHTVTGKGRARVNVTVSNFVPKAFVPFQWDGQMDRATVLAKQSWMRGLNRNKSVKLKFHSADQSYLEGVLSRGDRRLTPVLIGAWRRGARFDAWREHFDLSRWLEACEEAGIDPDAFALRERGEDEVLPWDHIDIGPDRQFLWRERMRARELIKTDYCVGKVCHVCGVPPSLCFAIKRELGLLGTKRRGILEMDEQGATVGLEGVADSAPPARLKSASPGPVRAPRRAGATSPAPSTTSGPRSGDGG